MLIHLVNRCIVYYVVPYFKILEEDLWEFELHMSKVAHISAHLYVNSMYREH